MPTTQPSLINLHPNEYSQGLRYYLLADNLDRCVGCCNTLNGLSNKVCVSNKTEDLTLGVFNMIARINHSKTLTKHISSECKCKFDGRKFSSNKNGMTINAYVSVKDIIHVKNIKFGTLL